MFNLPFVWPIDPNSPPAQQRQQLAPGMIPGPVPPVRLTSGFHPPGVSGFGPPPTPQPEPGFSVRDGFAAFSDALGKLKPNAAIDPALAEARRIAQATTSYPGTNAAGLLAGVNPDAGIGGGWQMPPANPAPLDFLTGRQWPNASWENFRG